mmetsp:Transcript_53558/g.123104  ORF Transcript_53558/g.123104 Transcript_53558/m.123104 type:complete len:357 (+) Transcript_53558:33-1103(+)
MPRAHIHTHGPLNPSSKPHCCLIERIASDGDCCLDAIGGEGEEIAAARAVGVAPRDLRAHLPQRGCEAAPRLLGGLVVEHVGVVLGDARLLEGGGHHDERLGEEGARRAAELTLPPRPRRKARVLHLGGNGAHVVVHRRHVEDEGRDHLLEPLACQGRRQVMPRHDGVDAVIPRHHTRVGSAPVARVVVVDGEVAVDKGLHRAVEEVAVVVEGQPELLAHACLLPARFDRAPRHVRGHRRRVAEDAAHAVGREGAGAVDEVMLRHEHDSRLVVDRLRAVAKRGEQPAERVICGDVLDVGPHDGVADGEVESVQVVHDGYHCHQRAAEGELGMLPTDVGLALLPQEKARTHRFCACG